MWVRNDLRGPLSAPGKAPPARAPAGGGGGARSPPPRRAPPARSRAWPLPLAAGARCRRLGRPGRAPAAAHSRRAPALGVTRAAPLMGLARRSPEAHPLKHRAHRRSVLAHALCCLSCPPGRPRAPGRPPGVGRLFCSGGAGSGGKRVGSTHADAGPRAPPPAASEESLHTRRSFAAPSPVAGPSIRPPSATLGPKARWLNPQPARRSTL
jgi:hypothetical protein